MQVRWTEFALDQLEQLVDQLAERRREPVRRRMVQHLMERVGALADLPWSAPPWRPAGDDSFRRLVVDEHIVLYRVIETEEAVFILAVRHGRERPPEPGDVPVR